LPGIRGHIRLDVVLERAQRDGLFEVADERLLRPHGISVEKPRRHASLRQRLESSPLMNAPLFAQNLESAYRQMWRRYCAK